MGTWLVSTELLTCMNSEVSTEVLITLIYT